MNHPTYTAKEIASLLDNDPIMAAQIKEFISVNRLYDLFEISPPEVTDKQILEIVKKRGLTSHVLEKATSWELMDEIKARI